MPSPARDSLLAELLFTTFPGLNQAFGRPFSHPDREQAQRAVAPVIQWLTQSQDADEFSERANDIAHAYNTTNKLVPQAKSSTTSMSMELKTVLSTAYAAHPAATSAGQEAFIHALIYQNEKTQQVELPFGLTDAISSSVERVNDLYRTKSLADKLDEAFFDQLRDAMVPIAHYLAPLDHDQLAAAIKSVRVAIAGPRSELCEGARIEPARGQRSDISMHLKNALSHAYVQAPMATREGRGILIEALSKPLSSLAERIAARSQAKSVDAAPSAAPPQTPGF